MFCNMFFCNKMKRFLFIILPTTFLFSCDKDKSNLERFKEKEKMLIELNDIIISNFDSIYYYYLPGEHSDLSLITPVHLNNDSTTKKKPTILRIQFLMTKLNLEEIIISENKEILILDILKSGTFNTEKYYWGYSESGNLTDVTISRLKLKQLEKLSNPKHSYFEPTTSISD